MLPKAPPPIDVPTAVATRLPAGACDAHIHLVADDFPLWDGRVEDPADGSLADYVARYRTHMQTFGLDRVVVVHSILYGARNDVTKAAVAALGGCARGIGLVTDDGTEADLDDLRAAGIMGVRLNYVHGGVLTWDGVKRLAPMLAERGMHVQMLMNTHKHMAELADDVRAMPVPVVFDHIGWPDLSLGVQEAGFEVLRQLVSEGAAHVKLSAPYRLCDAPYDAATRFIETLASANPDACLWGSDWPHIMLADAGMPDAGVLLNHFLETVTDADTRRRILVGTPARLYGF
ncbi:amidohydrolase [Nereida sp. MMG025]|uniref:amidohydrolase family protein n=1 Tax=Nereida sp. MMG025 TaxID=2909981 RepID=UPI001F3C50A7|nr:amidohydrolase family protein [Nereida sp. MMG025]MCF6444480.1 amidohydrolase family protein [Nereida sp. MMG025]